MNVADHKQRIRSGNSALHDAVESAQSIQTANQFFPRGITVQSVVIALLAVGAVIAAGAVSYYGVPTTMLLSQSIATENALTYYSTAAGIAGFAGSIIASSRLANVQGGSVSVGSMVVPVLVTAGGNFLAGFLFPNS